MKILFFGRTQGNSGPDNVNRAFYAHLTPNFLAAEPGGAFFHMVKDFWKLYTCQALVVSGLSRKGCILTASAKLLGRKAIYIMHGCAEFEEEVNHLMQPGPVKQERYLMRCSDRILAVSRKYRDWLADRYPEYADKLDHLNPGVPQLPIYKEKGIIPGSVMAAGADRPIKNNLPLARAVEELGGQLSLRICGASCHGDPFSEFRHTRYLGLLPQPEYWKKLRETEIFVVNSSLESFGLSALEALSCGCSLLVSRNAGVCDLLPLQEEDIICDPLDTEELKCKLKWIQAHPNHARLRAKQWTCEDAVARLEELCRKEGRP